MKSCEEFEELISEFLDGSLAKDEQIALMKHMSGCPACQKYFDDLVAMHEAMEELEEAQAPEDFSSRVMSAVRETKQDVPRKTAFPWKRWVALAACCVIAVGGIWAFQSRKNPPPSLQAAVTASSTYMARDAAVSESNEEGIDALADMPEEPEVPESGMEIASDNAKSAPAPALASPKRDNANALPEESKDGLTAVSPAMSSALITKEEAQTCALEHAGLSASEVTVTKTQLDWEDGRQVYDIEFYSPAAEYDSADRTEYDYEIDAATGSVVKYDQEAMNKSLAPVNNGSAAITEEAAKTIALGEVPGAAAEHITRSKLDYDDGAAVYEIEIVYGGTEYDFKIDAASGKTVKQDREAVDQTSSPAANDGSGLMTAEAAAAIALGEVPDAGTEHVTKSKLDHNGGGAVYEIEIIYGGTEYDFEIDAASGKIIKQDREAVNKVSSPAARSSSTLITMEEAKTIALGEVSGAAAEHITKSELDHDDGAAVYEIEIIYGGIEYDVEIDAATGEVIGFGADPVD